MASEQMVTELEARIDALEQLAMPDPRGSEFAARNLAQVLLAIR